MSERLPSPFVTPLPAGPAGAARRRRSAFLWRTLGLTALVLAATAAPASASEAASTQLSDGHTFSEVYFSSTPPQISPDGDYAVYVQDAVTNGAHELWSVALAGGDPVRLSDVLISGQSVKFAISPDSNYVVYLVDQDVVGVPELYSVPIAGGARTKLNMDFYALPGQVRDFVISPTSNRVYYAADGEVNNVIELWRVDIDGGASTRLNAEITSSYDIFEYAVGVTTGGSERVVYRVGRTVQGEHELWSVPGTGSSASAGKISRSTVTGGGVDPYFQISPNGTRVVYSADATDNGSFNLYSVAITGGSSTQLNGALGGAAGVEPDFVISPDSTKVAYRSDELTDNVLELYSVPITGGTPIKLNSVLPSGGDVAEQAIAADNLHVIYRADQVSDGVNELFSVSINGGTPVKLNPTPASSGDVLDFAISPDGARVIYRADQVTNDLNELFSVPVAGGTVTKLNGSLTTAGDVQAYEISPNSEFVVYGADQAVDAKDELFRVPIGGGTAETVNGPLVFDGDVSLTFLGARVFDISSDNLTIVYAADQVVNNEIELFKSTSVVLGPPGPPTSVVAVAGDGQVTVTFAAPTNNGGSPITGYAVTPSPATAGWVDNNSGSTALTHVVANLTNGTAYTFTVRATNVNGTGDPSAPSNVATPATVPSAPTAAAAVPRNHGADVTFTGSTNNGGSPITGYTVISNPPGGVDITQGTTLTKHFIIGLTNGTPYTFTVVAQNAIGPSLPSTASPAVTPDCIPNVGGSVFCDSLESSDTSAWSFTAGPPGAPTTVVAAGGNALATVTFVAPLADGGSPITGYTVTSIPAGGVDSNAGATGLSHVVTGLANGTSYTFTVQATNANGQGPASAPSNAVTPATVPAAPSLVVAVAGDSSATVTFVAPVDDGGSPILGYTVTSDPAGGVDSNAGQLGLSHAITGLANGTEYTFTVTATNAAGTGSPSKPSNPVTPSPS